MRAAHPCRLLLAGFALLFGSCGGGEENDCDPLIPDPPDAGLDGFDRDLDCDRRTATETGQATSKTPSERPL